MTRLLDTLELPKGLRTLSVTQLEQISKELREELIDVMSSSAGHFASSLGATEISVALHAFFHTPDDKIIWDTGHQGYIHKMLTGRRGDLSNIRKKGGISGFLKRSESAYDVFGAGHAGTSISAAVGVRVALDSTPQGSDRHVVAVIGDGSLTSGMVFEALNHAGDLQLKKFIVLLNDNEMSISPNVGAISWLFSRAITSKASNWARAGVKHLYQQGYVPTLVYKAMDKAEEAAQGFFATPAMLFESFGFRYIGPIDGHNMSELKKAIEHAKTQDVPTIIHTSTVKGMGYAYAETDPIKWHAVNPFDKEKGEFLGGSSGKPTAPSYTQVFAKTVIELGKENPKIKAITAAMPTGTGLDLVQKELPSAVYDVGICEQHAVTFAAGLATEGFQPVCAIYSTFLQRGYDQVLHDVCIQNLPVVFAIDRAGVVGNDGETHHGVFDISYLRSIPHMTICAPKHEGELRHLLATALSYGGPVAVRYPRGNGVGASLTEPLELLPIGKGEVLQEGKEVCILCFGPIIQEAIKAADELEERQGVKITLVNMRWAKPLDLELLRKMATSHGLLCTLEDHVIQGGFGSAVLEGLQQLNLQGKVQVHHFGIHDEFVPHGSQSEQYAMQGYDAASIVEFLYARFSQTVVLPQRVANLC